jgi:hypothetical protein
MCKADATRLKGAVRMRTLAKWRTGYFRPERSGLQYPVRFSNFFFYFTLKQQKKQEKRVA